MTCEELLIAIDVEAPHLTNGALRLLLRLIGLAIQQGSNVLHASDRWIGQQLAMSNKGVTTAKKGIAHLVAIEAKDGVVTTFRMPAEWFAPQRSLFSTESALLTSARSTPGEGATALPERAPVHSLGRAPALLESAPALLERAPRTWNQQDAGASSISKSNSGVSNTVQQYVFSILSIRSLAPELRPQAAVLAPELQHALYLAGSIEVAQTPPDDVVLAQCLTIAPLREILPAIQLAKARKGKPRGYVWFVSVLMEAIHGISRADFAAVREEWRHMRQPKPPASERGGSFQSDLLAQAAGQVKRLH